MKKLIPEKFAAYGILSILSLIIIFHTLILVRAVPFEIVWGGRLETVSQMIFFEAVSIGINLLMIAVVLFQSGMTRFKINQLYGKICLWLMFALFLLNTLGNLLSQNEMETLIFTPLTFILAILSLRMALADRLS